MSTAFPSGATVRIVTQSVAHMHAKPSRDSEQVSQTLLGHRVAVLGDDYSLEPAPGGWAYIETDDGYRGWVETRWLGEKTNAFVLSAITGSAFADVRESPLPDSPLLMRLPMGALVAVGDRDSAAHWLPITLPDARTQGWMLADAFADPPFVQTAKDDIGSAVVALARESLGTPYLWGGSSAFGFDCSGLVQFCYRLAANVILRRDADIQRSDPRFVSVDKADLAPGDLVFFGKPDNITHIGMHAGHDRFIHAAGGAGVILTIWGDERYSPGYVDSRRLNLSKIAEPVTRDETADR